MTIKINILKSVDPSLHGMQYVIKLSCSPEYRVLKTWFVLTADFDITNHHRVV